MIKSQCLTFDMTFKLACAKSLFLRYLKLRLFENPTPTTGISQNTTVAYWRISDLINDAFSLNRHKWFYIQNVLLFKNVFLSSVKHSFLLLTMNCKAYMPQDKGSKWFYFNSIWRWHWHIWRRLYYIRM